MWSQEVWNIQVIHHLLPRSTDIQQVKHLPPNNTWLGPPVFTQETVRLSECLSQLLRSFHLSRVGDVTEED